MREIVHIQAGQCGNQIGAKVRSRELTKEFKAFPGFWCMTFLFLPLSPVLLFPPLSDPLPRWRRRRAQSPDRAFLFYLGSRYAASGTLGGP